MSRYLIDESRLSFEQSRGVNARVLGWAIPRADAFSLTIDSTIYANAAQLAQIAALGEGASSPGARRQTIKGGKPPSDFISVVTAEMTLMRSVSGDLSCVEDIMLHCRGTRFYAMIDYGRTQIVEVDEDAISDLRRALGADADVLIPAPAVRR